jgi:hypothetical protein
MRETHRCLVFVVVLLLGLSPALPAEDLPGTTYDETEAQPYESSVPISNLMAQTASETQTALSETQAVESAPRLQTSTPFPLAAQPLIGAHAHRFTVARGLLAQVCTLLF